MLEPDSPEIPDIVTRIADRLAAEPERGRVADYIPELARVDIDQFGIVVAPVNGQVAAAGDADTLFSIQSISKVFTLILALEKIGTGLWRRVGREPSGDPFNSIIQLEYEHGVPRNPFINAGAIVVADVILDGRTPRQALNEILAITRTLAQDDSVDVDLEVAASEMRTGFRNFALANFIRAEGNLDNPAEDVLEVYFKQCAIAMSCRQLAVAGRCLARAGVAGDWDKAIITPARARRVNALMLTCGHYDASGEFAYQVGIPSKSGVGGGIMGVVPGIAAVASWCPGLDDKGNSVLAARALEMLERQTGWSVFSPQPGSGE